MAACTLLLQQQRRPLLCCCCCCCCCSCWLHPPVNGRRRCGLGGPKVFFDLNLLRLREIVDEHECARIERLAVHRFQAAAPVVSAIDVVEAVTIVVVVIVGGAGGRAGVAICRRAVAQRLPHTAAPPSACMAALLRHASCVCTAKGRCHSCAHIPWRRRTGAAPAIPPPPPAAPAAVAAGRVLQGSTGRGRQSRCAAVLGHQMPCLQRAQSTGREAGRTAAMQHAAVTAVRYWERILKCSAPSLQNETSELPQSQSCMAPPSSAGGTPPHLLRRCLASDLASA